MMLFLIFFRLYKKDFSFTFLGHYSLKITKDTACIFPTDSDKYNILFDSYANIIGHFNIKNCASPWFLYPHGWQVFTFCSFH